MSNLKNTAALLLVGSTLCGSLLVLGCRNEPKVLGEAAPAGIERATLEEILQDKAGYAGKVVLIEGRAGGLGCADCGGILVTDRTWRMLVEPENPSLFRIEPRKAVPVRAWGVVRVEGSEAEEGAEAEEAGDREAAEEGDAAHAKLHQDLGNVELKARGVEWL